MTIKLLNTRRMSTNSVEVDYTLGNEKFTVEWSNIHPGTGDLGDYDLQVYVKSDDEDLAERVSDAIRAAETDENIDLDLYLSVRDMFDASDCADIYIYKSKSMINCTKDSLPLVEYIDQHYAGNKSAFAASQGVKRQQVTKWINGGFIVVDHVLYSPRRELGVEV